MAVATSVRQSPSGPIESLPKSGGAVTSWNGRTGVVLPEPNDYDSDEIDNASGVGGATVSDALISLDFDITALQVALANLDTDDVANASGVGGATTTDALNTLDKQIADLGSDNIANQSTVLAGKGSVSDALDELSKSSGGAGVGTFASRPAVGKAGALYFATDGVVAQFVDDGSAWRPLIGGVVGVEVPALAAFNASWSTYNPGGGPSISVAAANAGLLFSGLSDSVVQNRGWSLPCASSGDVSIEICLDDLTVQLGLSRFTIWGCGLRKASTAQSYVLSLAKVDGLDYSVYFLDVSQWTNDTTRASFVQPRYGMLSDGNGPWFLRMARAGANFVASVSRDRVNWKEVVSVGAVFAGADQLIIATDVINATSPTGVAQFMLKHLAVSP